LAAEGGESVGVFSISHQ